MIEPIVETRDAPAAPRRSARGTGAAPRRGLAPLALVLALLTSGCDKCGDYFWQGGSKSCHDESQLK
jgi:hypothetical protein